MKKNQKICLFIFGIILLFVFSIYYEFKKARVLGFNLERSGFSKSSGEELSFVTDGLFYFFTKGQRRKFSRYQTQVGETSVNISYDLQASHSRSGSSNFFSTIKIVVKLSGRKDLFHFIKDYQCPAGNYSDRNSTYSKVKGLMSASLENGIPISQCYTQPVVDRLSNLLFCAAGIGAGADAGGSERYHVIPCGHRIALHQIQPGDLRIVDRTFQVDFVAKQGRYYVSPRVKGDHVEQRLGQTIFVPPLPQLTGAFGAALFAREAKE